MVIDILSTLALVLGTSWLFTAAAALSGLVTHR